MFRPFLSSTGPVCDEDRGVGSRGVSPSRHSVDCDGVVGIRLQVGDDCSSLGAWNCELLGSFTSCRQKRRKIQG